jgi:hypothetical protein
LKLMNSTILYQMMSELVNPFSLECRVKRVLKDFALGTLASESCQLEAIAHALQARGRVESQYRRLQRFLANPHVQIVRLQKEWAQRVVQTMRAAQVVLLVDETSLSDHLKVMVLGVWSRGGCVSLAWHCYTPDAYPAQGQAQMSDLLTWVMPSIPLNLPVWLLAD